MPRVPQPVSGTPRPMDSEPRTLALCCVLLNWFHLLVFLQRSVDHHALPTASLRESVWLVIGLPPFLPPSDFPSIIVFAKAPCLLMMCPKWGSFIFVVFASSDISGLICSGTHFFIFLVVPGIRRALLQHHTPNGSIFPCLPSSLFGFHICTWSLGIRGCGCSPPRPCSPPSISVYQPPLPASPSPCLGQPP